jgi:hypothetical protein
MDYITTDTYKTLPIPKINISAIDANKINTLGLSTDNTKLLSFIYYYLSLSGLFQGDNILLISIDILAKVIHHESNIDLETFRVQINNYFRHCETHSVQERQSIQSIQSIQSQTQEQEQDISPIPLTIKSVLHDNITILKKIKQLISLLLANTSIQLQQFEDIIKQLIGNTPLPNLSTATSFTLYMTRVEYSLHTKDTVNNTVLQLNELYTKLIIAIDNNIQTIESLLQLDHASLLKQLTEYKQLHVKPIQFFVDKHITNLGQDESTTVTTDYIFKIISIQLHNFLFDIPIYSYHNIYEKQIHVQKRLKKMLINIHQLCKVSPFLIHIDISFGMIDTIYTLPIDFGHILDIIDFKPTQSVFSLEEFFKQLIVSEVNQYIHMTRNTQPPVSMEQILENLLFEVAVYIYNELIPNSNSFIHSGHIVLDTPTQEKTVSSLQSTMNTHLCKGKSLPELTELIKLIVSPTQTNNKALEDFFKSNESIIDLIPHPNILLFNIESSQEIDFIVLLDIFLGLCSSGVIQSFGKLSRTFIFDDTFLSEDVRVIEPEHTFRTYDTNTSVNITYYIRSTCKEHIEQTLLDSQSVISKNIFKIKVVV